MFVNKLDHPVFVSLGPLNIYYYGILLVLAFIIGYFILVKLAKERNIKKELIDELIIYLIPAIIIGARLFEILFYDFNYYLDNPIKVFYIWEGGIASHGALLFGILTVLIFCKIKKISFYQLADILVIPSALAGFFIRIGNFINGEIPGRISNLPWAVKFKDFEGFRHPSQLYESFIALITFIILYNVRKLKLKPGFLFWLFITLFSFLRFLVEFFKEGQLTFGLTTGQLLSIPFFLLGLIMLIRKQYKKAS